MMDSEITGMVIAGHIAVPLIIMLLVMPYMIRKLTENGYVVRDYYKPVETMVPTKGGLVILLVAMFSTSLGAFFTELPASNYKILVVLALFGLFGMLDDLINIGRQSKLILLYFCSFPLSIPFIASINGTCIHFPLIGAVDGGLFYLYLIVPTYVLVTSNLVNMHSGFNGLATGTSLIVLAALLVKSVFYGTIDHVVVIASLTGATLGFLWYDRYPSRIFWGNIGSLTIGAAIGITIVTQGFLVSGFVMLIPHTVNFLMYFFWRLARLPPAKFGKVGPDGKLTVPNPLTLKWVLPYYFKLTEREATWAMYAVSAIFATAGVFIHG